MPNIKTKKTETKVSKIITELFLKLKETVSCVFYYFFLDFAVCILPPPDFQGFGKFGGFGWVGGCLVG